MFPPVLVHEPELARARAGAWRASLLEPLPRMLPYLLYPRTWRLALHGLTHGALSNPRVNEPQPFHEQRPLDVPGQPSPVATPGHTQGHVSYHMPDRGVVLSGDALVTLDVLTGDLGPRLNAAPFNTDTSQAYDSLAALEPLEATLLLPGHGRPWRGAMSEAVAQARAAAR